MLYFELSHRHFSILHTQAARFTDIGSGHSRQKNFFHKFWPQLNPVQFLFLNLRGATNLFNSKIFLANKETTKHIRCRKFSAGFYISSAQAFRSILPAAVASGAENQHLTAFSSLFFTFRRELLLSDSSHSRSSSRGWRCSQGSAIPEVPRLLVLLCSSCQPRRGTKRLQLPALTPPPPSALNILRLKLAVTTETTRRILLLFAAARFSGQQGWQITEFREQLQGHSPSLQLGKGQSHGTAAGGSRAKEETNN